MKCQTLNRDVTINECAHAQKEIPKKFCEGCEWFTETIKEMASMRSSYIPSIYKVRVSSKLKNKLIEEAKKKGIQPAAYITKILAEKLSEIT